MSWLKKVSDGFLFREDFENREFITNDQWQTLQGVPELSDAWAIAGTFSLDMGPNSNDTNGRPAVIRQPINPSPVFTHDWMITCWFYDTMDAVLEGAFLKVSTGDSKFYQVGVRNAVSTTKYAVNQNSNTSEDTFTASTATRTLGWHKFQIHRNLVGTVDIYIDDVLIQIVSFVSVGPLAFVSIQGAILGHVTNSFGYFDELRVQNSKSALFYGLTGRTVQVGTSAPVFSASPTFSFVPSSSPNPNSYSLQVSKSEKQTSLELFWLSQDFNGGDVYYYQSIDFGRKAYPVNFTTGNLGSRSTSTSGRIESITTGYQNRLTFSLQVLEGEDWRQKEVDFFEWIRFGNPVTVMIDSDDTVMTTIASTFPSVGSSSISVNQNLGTGLVEAVAGSNYIIESADRTGRQIVKVSVNPVDTTINFTPPLSTNFAQNDIFRSVTFFPMMILDPNTSQLTYQEARYLRYNWSFQMVEYIQ